MLILILVALITGIAVAAIVNPQGQVRGVLEKILHIPEDTTIYESPEVLPSSNMDMEKFYRFIISELHYPESAADEGVEGHVVVSFVVEKDGSLTNFEALNSPDERLGAEAIRVIQLTAPWHPAQNKKKTVRSRFCMPINFRLK